MTTSDILFSLNLSAIRAGDYLSRWAYDAIAWYVVSDRACRDWCQALGRCNPDKLIAHVAASRDSSADGMIAACTRYLKRYGKLAA